jgi:tetratricopeptide (TPR) repeat protein
LNSLFKKKPIYEPKNFFGIRRKQHASPQNRRDLLKVLAEKIESLRSIATNLLLLSVVGFVCYVGYNELTKDVIVVEPFEVPKILHDQGYTGKVLASMLIDQFDSIRATAKTSMKKKEFAQEAGADKVSLQIPGAGVSLQSIVQYARELIKPHTHIVGEAYQSGSNLILTLHVGGYVLPPDSSSSQSIPQLVNRAAQNAMKIIQPYVLAVHYYYVGDTTRMFETINRILSQPSHAEAKWAFNLWGGALHDLGKEEEAIEKYKKAIELDPNDASPYNGWGNALGDLGKEEGAIEKYKKAIELDPKYAISYYNWGIALSDLGKEEEAIEKYKKTIELDPNDTSPYNGWGNALGELGKNEEAIEKYKKAIELDPKFALPYVNWGIALLNLGKKEEAIEKYKKAIELDPKYAFPYNGWGNALSDLDKKEEAIEKYKKAIELDPKYASAYYNWGIVLRALGKQKEAIEKYKKVVELDGESELGKKAKQRIELLSK